MNPRNVALAQARGRIAVGAAMLALPGLATRIWIGRDSDRPATKVIPAASAAVTWRLAWAW